FCSIHNTMGQRFRARGPENIISEIRRLAADYNIRHINFEDDNLTLDKKRAEAIFDLMIKSRLNLTWSAPNGLRVESLNEGMVEKMKLSGCKRVFVAPESGVQRVVSEIIRKDLDLRKIDKAISLFKRSGICVDGSFVIGLIGETQNDIWETIKYALRLKRLGMDKAGIHIATPYYGTKLYEEARQKGFLRKDLDSSLFSTCEPLIETPEWSGEELHRLYVIANWLVNFRLRDKVIFVFYNLKDLPRYLRYLWRVFVSLVAK
ncbi:MAG: B12-binding domain-containing radical SAM protein, partial [Candidatus Omnitrophota bacterium]